MAFFVGGCSWGAPGNSRHDVTSRALLLACVLHAARQEPFEALEIVAVLCSMVGMAFIFRM